MLKIPKSDKMPPMPPLPEIIPFKPLRPKIKTIVDTNTFSFDNKVNTELRNGWGLREIKIIPLETATRSKIFLYAVLERLVEVDENKDH